MSERFSITMITELRDGTTKSVTVDISLAEELVDENDDKVLVAYHWLVNAYKRSRRIL